MEISSNKKKRVAIVTGGARGIGSAIALRLASSGIQVIVADLSKPDSKDFLFESAETYTKPIFVQCDVSSEKDIQHLIKKIENDFGGADILVNNAGIISKHPFFEIPEDSWDSVFRVNVKGSFLLSKAVIPGMIAQKNGRIINIASVAAQVGGGFLGDTCYAASKGAIISMTKGIAREYAGNGITCNAICPGFVETEITLNMPEEQRNFALQIIPAHRSAIPKDIASAVFFLASQESSYINGVTLNVDGGLIRH